MGATNGHDPRTRLLLAALRQQEQHVTDHSRRVQRIALALGRRLSLDPDSLTLLSASAVLHDLGKFLVPGDLLAKPGPLTRRERDIMTEHAALTGWLCEGLPWLTPAIPIVRAHHERLDGSGYPDGLTGSQVPLLAQIVQLADISDALLSPRSYKPAFPLDQAAETLLEEARRGWRDRALVDECLAVLEQVMAPAPPMELDPCCRGSALTALDPHSFFSFSR
jgi:putative two-component system response regulator